MSSGEIVGVIGLVIAALTFFANQGKGWRARNEADATRTQILSDKIDTLTDIARDTRDDVRELDRKFDNHESRLTKAEALLAEYARRLEHIERKE